MKFGLFYNPMVPRRPGELEWEPGEERNAFKSTLEQIQLADRLGIDYVFLGEHHFSAQYAHNSASEVLLGAIAATTKHIRLGTAITQTSHNDPVRVAERIAMADLISDGRVEFGLGSGSPHEVAAFFQNFGVDQSKRKARTDAAAQIAVDILGSRGAWPGAKNEFFDYPPANVVPKSHQLPHPPLWTSTTGPGMADGVAKRGLGQLMLTVGGPELVAREVQAYWNALRGDDVKPVGRAINPAVFTFTSGLLAPTDQLAKERGREGLEFFGFGLMGGAAMTIQNPEFHLWDEFKKWKAGGKDPRATPPPMDFAYAPGQTMFGPDRAKKLYRQFEAAHSDGVLLNQQFGHTKHEHMMESIEILARDVIPEFREREPEHEAWRAEQLKGVDLPIYTTVSSRREALVA